jgi:ribosome-associated heat shock protein Hsp15
MSMARAKLKGLEDDANEADAPATERRIDKWLYYTRAVKTRSLAASLATGGKIRVNGVKLEKSSQKVKVGDVVTFAAHQRIRVFKVIATGVRRGPAAEAQALYTDLTPPPVAAADAPPPLSGQRDAGAGRPTKRDRRALDRMRDD